MSFDTALPRLRATPNCRATHQKTRLHRLDAAHVHGKLERRAVVLWTVAALVARDEVNLGGAIRTRCYAHKHAQRTGDIR